MKSTAVLLTLAVYSLEPSPVTGREIYVQRLPNGGNVAGAPAIGHSDKTGHLSSLNAFGKAFEKAGNKWTTALCQADSDGDGQTNGQELGDPCCEWSTGKTPRFTDGVSHPSDASSKADPKLWESITCPTVTTTGTASPAPAQATSPFVLIVGLVAGVAGVAALGAM